MNQDEIQDHLQLQLALLKKEKAADYAFYQERMMNTSIQERVKNGVTWYPIQITHDFVSTGDRLTLEIEKKSRFAGKTCLSGWGRSGNFYQHRGKGKAIVWRGELPERS